MRAIWKGHIQFSLVTIPIRLYTAVDSEKSIEFDLLTREGHHPIGYVKTDKVSGQPVEKEEIVRGFQYEPEHYVIMEEADFEKVKPKTTRMIEIKGFVEHSDVNPGLYEQPYFIGPENEFARKTYHLFRKTLEMTGKTGVGSVVLRNRESPVLLTVHEGGILMYKLRYPEQLRKMSEVPLLNGEEEEPDKKQLELAKTLVDSMSAGFAELDLKNRYYEAMKEMVEAKVKGEEVVTVAEEEPEARDIMTALKESIEAAKKERKGKKKKAPSAA